MRTLGMVHIVERFPYVTAVAASTVSALYAAAVRLRPDIVLFGPVCLPDGEPATFTRLRQLTGGCRFITYDDSTHSRVNPPNVSAGLCAFLPSMATPEDFDRAFSAALAGFTYFPQDLAAELIHGRIQFPQLSPREQEVLNLLSGGLSNHRIARTLGIKETTVKMYVTQVLAKLNVESRLQACLKARGLEAAAA
ncbi:hypothetical protein SGFS_072240 [Streptomyces graminofaciens]|uniref:HTH luxR-type domain-containing protein n=2 Tax=Streptomyces graminofaciens TaxID=68212 RepID=A0ABM7FHV1_9ACTN|nr:hypothetical protein SGFS_072240 [Streptomyces graminofaciens]